MLVRQNELKALVDELRAQGQTIVTTNGCFDILHAGHVKYLEKTAAFADKTIVLMNSDSSVKKLKGQGRPINNETDRAAVLSALRYVDYVVLFEQDTPSDLLEIIRPDVHTKGADYTAENLPEAGIILENGGRLEFIEFVEGKSTTNTIKEMKR